jgi:hypothetical protein
VHVSAFALNLHYLFNGPLHEDISSIFFNDPGKILVDASLGRVLGQTRWITFEQNNRRLCRC